MQGYKKCIYTIQIGAASLSANILLVQRMGHVQREWRETRAGKSLIGTININRFPVRTPVQKETFRWK
jgi:hypothetical protein